MSDLGERVVAAARQWIDVPYFHAGRTREGIDCIGLLAVVAHELKITDFDDLNYPPEPDPQYLTAILEQFAERKWFCPPNHWQEILEARGAITMNTLLPGDLLQFEIMAEPRHAGIYAENVHHQATIIHCYQSAGKVVEHLFDRHWQKRLWAAYRFREAVP